MSTSDPNEHGPLTRKQLREIRLTGSTPVITAEEAAAAAESSAPSAPPVPQVEVENAQEAPREESPATDAPIADASVAPSSGALTRRQVRARERGRTGPVDAAEGEAAENESAEAAAVEHEQPPVEDAQSASHDEEPIELEVIAREPEAGAPTIVAGVPEFAHPAPGAQDDVDSSQTDDDEGVDDVATDERPVVNPAFGVGVLSEPVEPPTPFTPSFDELLTVGDSTGSQHVAPSALIFTPSPGEGSLSGPVASTGEILVTGSYELPRGMGSQGHAHGTTDGKDVDAVLIDGELAASSSPTPIAASSAVSTIKPAGEVIRPPAPEKGNKLMLILAITAGGLALALGVVLVFAITTNVF